MATGEPIYDSAASHQEVADLKLQMTALSVKLDVVSSDLNRVNIALARQDGANLPDRIKELDRVVKELETVRDSRAWMPDALINVQTKVENLEFFKWKMIGIITVVQVALTIVGKFVLDSIWHPIVQVVQP